MIAVVAVAATQVAMAHSWRINNDASKGAHFASINEAMTSEQVVDGDTLYLDPGCVLSDDQTITKAVTVIGTGWDFNNRPYVYAQVKNLKVTAAATKIIGLYITGTLYPVADNVSIERCRIDGNISNNLSDYTKTYYNLKLMSSYLPSGYVYGSSSSSCYMFAIISNCIIRGGYNGLRGLTNATVTNNVILFTNRNSYSSETGYVLYLVNNSVFRNNIMMGVGSSYYNRMEYSCSGNSFMNNCLSANGTTSYAAENANVCMNTYDLSAVFLNDGAVGGAAYKLCEGSPAKGAGVGGIDCGPYAEGSLYPFVTYGLPEHIPYFTEAVIPTRPTDGKVKVTLKIENQNR